MSDPYAILGVSERASEIEIKHAYRELSRKYHPDANVDNPLVDITTEKFREVQEAYNQIMEESERGESHFNYSGYSEDYTKKSTGTSEDDLYFIVTLNYINASHFREALNVLNTIENHNARWFYFSAVANMGIGNNLIALNHAKKATNMEPGNIDYAKFYHQLQAGGGRYESYPYSSGQGSQDSCGTGNICCDLWCANTLCECIGGNLCL